MKYLLFDFSIDILPIKLYIVGTNTIIMETTQRETK